MSVEFKRMEKAIWNNSWPPRQALEYFTNSVPMEQKKENENIFYD